MNLCDVCQDPATHSSVMSDRGKKSVHRLLCYVHAAEANLLDIPVQTLSVIADDCGFKVNAVIFVLESLVREDLALAAPATDDLDDLSASVESYNLLPRGLTMSEMCLAIKQSAIRRFGRDAEAVFMQWQIPNVSDLG